MNIQAQITDVNTVQRGANKFPVLTIQVKQKIEEKEREWTVFHSENQFINLKQAMQSIVNLTGQLQKKVIGKWVSFPFKLSGNILSYKTSSTNLHEIDLMDAKHIIPTGTRCELQIRTTRETLDLRATDDDASDEWLMRLNQAKKKFQNENTWMSPSKGKALAATDLLDNLKARFNCFLEYACEEYNSFISSPSLSSSSSSTSSSSSSFNSEINAEAFAKLADFLMLNQKREHKYPQLKKMVDSMMDYDLVREMHENCGVPLVFSHRGLISDPDGQSIFSYACEFSSFKTVEYMLKDVQISNTINERDFKSGNSPLIYACRGTAYNTADLLLSSGASTQSSLAGFNGLHMLAQSADPPQTEASMAMFENLVAKLVPTCLNSQNKIGQTPLHVCVKSAYILMFETLLVKHNASYSIPDELGKTVLHLLSVECSTKSFEMMDKLLEHMWSQVKSEKECDKQLLILDMEDVNGKTAIQNAKSQYSCSRHVSLLLQHHNRLEEYKFSKLINLLISYSPPSPFPPVENYLYLSINSYHSNIPSLIEKGISLQKNLFNILDEKPTDSITELKTAVENKIYPCIMSLFLEKNKLDDNLLRKKLIQFKRQVDHQGYGIKPKLWNKIQSALQPAIETLQSISIAVRPLEKLECLRAALRLCNCEGADDEVPTLCYLMMVMSDDPSAPYWHAEIDYCATLDPEASVLFAQGVLQYFSVAHLKKNNDIVYVDSVDAVVGSTSRDVQCLWMDIRKEVGALDQIEKLYSLFLQCANNLSGKSQFVLDEKGEVLFEPYLFNNHFMNKIKRRIGFEFTKDEKTQPEETEWTIKYGEFVDPSSFSKMATAFSELKVAPQF